MEALKYLPFETIVDTAFWHQLAKKKLEEYRLSEGPFPITAVYSNNLANGLNPRVIVDISSFQNSDVIKVTPASTFTINGSLTVVNNLENFKNLEKQAFIDTAGQKMFTDALHENAYLKNPDQLTRFNLLTYCDLKHHKFYFWFAYPAVLSQIQPSICNVRRLDEEFSDKQIALFLTSYKTWRCEHSSAFFSIKTESLVNDQISVKVGSCVDFDSISSGSYLGFCDSSTHPRYPSWPLRNILYALSAKINEKSTVRILCLRERVKEGQYQCGHSLVLTVELSPIASSSYSQFVGWEKFNNQLKPRIVDLSSSMDPAKLSESAVSLNLKLMKWRLMPELNLDKIRDTKCLLIGSGTLGCHVARQLMAWGIRTITFVDKSNVSTSNPVRQSLFTFEDTMDGGKPKSETAAASLTKIFPGIHARGFQLGIPMPGHAVSSQLKGGSVGLDQLPRDLGLDIENLKLPPRVAEVYKTCSSLDELVKTHDAVFLLTDTRESRWLPAHLSCVHGKIVINAALGFDTYLVMRHGVTEAGISPSNISNLKQDEISADFIRTPRKINGENLGCYFCNDVVGPTNSTQNLSLDQQCTVTRPGVSMIASSLAVELLVSILQHPDGSSASAPVITQPEAFGYSTANSMSLIPHQIRGFLTQYSNVLPATAAFARCPACSQLVLDAYKEDGFRFLLNAFDDANYLEQVCGLKELQEMTRDDQVVALSDSDDE